MSRHSLIAAAAASPQAAEAARGRIRSHSASAARRLAALTAPTAFIDCGDGTFFDVHPAPEGFCAVIGHPWMRTTPRRRAGAAEILRAYRESGTGLLESLSGGFAIVVHDSQARRTLFAVDRIGVHSLCYALDGDAVIVGRYADEVAAALPRVPDLSLQAIYDYLHFHVIPSPETVFSGVRRLEAAHWAQFGEGGLEVRRYWQPDFAARPAEGFARRAHAYRDLLRDAVAREAAGAHAGAFLSGGTDSSSVVGWLSRTSATPARAWSIGFDAEGYDEMAYARIAAKHFGVEHHEYYVTPADIVAGVPRLAAHYDQPFGNSSALPAYFCALRAREAGVERMLAGDGGDEIFGGNVRYAKQQVFEWYRRLPAALRGALLDPVFGGGALSGVPLLRKAASYVNQANLPLPGRLHTYNLLDRLGVGRMFTVAFLQAVDRDRPAREQQAVYDRCTDASVTNRLLAYDLKYTLEDADLPKVVHTCELAGCEVRFPMLDDELVAFANGLPPEDKVDPLRLRLRPFFKDASRGFLPEAILSKSKHGFGLPFGAWVLHDAPLQAFARERVMSLADRGLLQTAFVDSVFSRELPAHPGFYGEAVWILMMLGCWLDEHDPGFALAR